MKLKNTLTALLAATFAVSPVMADEGMWLLPFLKQQNSEQLKKAGLLIDIDDIYSPDSTSMKDAVVIFGGGCTGEIISPEGLILTNHHCGYDAIQQHSTVEHDYLTDGFWAMEKKDELPTPGLQVRFIEKIEEVTDSINKAVEESGNEMNAFSTLFLNKQARKMAGEEFLAENPFAEVVIKPFYGGNRYFMFTITVYNDVRMVGAPPSSIGKFGADTDNWMWPRHTGRLLSLPRVHRSRRKTGRVQCRQCADETQTLLQYLIERRCRKRLCHDYGISRYDQPLLYFMGNRRHARCGKCHPYQHARCASGRNAR